MVRVHPDPPAKAKGADDDVEDLRGCSSVGRAPALQAGGHRFDPVHLHHSEDRRQKTEDRNDGRWWKFEGSTRQSKVGEVRVGQEVRTEGTLGALCSAFGSKK